MLRAVIMVKSKSEYSGAEYKRFVTLDFDSQELEEALRSGGLSEGGYEIPELVGIEVLPQPTE